MQRRRKRNVETLRTAIVLAVSCLGLIGCSEQKMAQVAGRVVYAADGTLATDLAGHRVSFLCNQGDDDEKKRAYLGHGCGCRRRHVHDEYL